MDALAHLSPATKARRTILNDTMRGLNDLWNGRGVTQIVFDPDAIQHLREAGRLPRTLLHPSLLGFKK